MKNRIKYILSAILLSTTVWLPAQNNTATTSKNGYIVTGLVTDAVSGAPLQGVSVTSSFGASALTDDEGRYKITLLSNKDIVTYSIPGYMTQEVALRGKKVQNVKMYTDSFTSEKSGDNIFSPSASLSLDEELGQRFGGDMRIISRGSTAGIGANMFVRGYNSVNLNAQPLIVIDGVIQNTENVESVFEGFYINALANIDVNDIEKVEILKDASSIYGSKGANGAILISTKRGRSFSTKIAVNMNWGLQLRPVTPRMMDAPQYRAYISEMTKGNEEAYKDVFNDNSDIATNLTYNTYHNDYDWTDVVYRNGFRQYYGLNIEGGDNIAQYVLSMAYQSGKGVVKTTDYNRLNTHFNCDVSLNKYLSLFAGFDFSYTSRNLLDDGINQYTSPGYLSLIKSPLLLPYTYSNNGLNYTNNLSEVDIFGISNPQSILDNSKGNFKQYRFGINVMPKLQITKMFDLSSRFAYGLNAIKEHYYSPLKGVAPQVQPNGSVYENTVKDQSITQDQLFSDTKFHFGNTFDRHKVNAELGLRIQSNIYKSNYEDGHNTGSDKIVNLSTSLNGKSVNGKKTTVRNSAIYLHADYTFDNRYGIWGTVVTEACSTFGRNVDAGYRFLHGTWATFPSVGANWSVSSEEFMQDADWLDKFNIRIEYGITGNDGLDILARYSYLQPVNYFGNAAGLQIGNLGNENLKWETTRKFNVGADFAFFDNRLGFGFDYFRHKTSDLLMFHNPDFLSGLDPYLSNGGNMENSGYEINLNARLVNKKNFKWNAEFGFMNYKNEMTDLTSDSYNTSVGNGYILTSVNNPLGVFYGYKTVEENGSIVFQTEQQAQQARLQTWDENKQNRLSFHAGDIHFADLDGNNLIDENDRCIIGNPNPTLTGSFMNRFGIGPVSVEIFFTYSIGNDIYNYQRHLLESGINLNNQTQAMTNRWKYEGQITDMPRAVYGDPVGNSRFSDRFIENGSYLKLKDIRVTYQLPVNIPHVQGLTIWASASNLYTWTNYLGADPEISGSANPLMQGVDFGRLPSNRAFNFGIKLNL